MKLSPARISGRPEHKRASHRALRPSSPAPELQLQLETILVPVDFSSSARKALRYAFALARDYGARLIVLHIVEAFYAGSEVASPDLPLVEKQRCEMADKKLREFLREAGCDALEPQVIVTAGNPLREIVEIAQSLQVDLLLISTHAKSALPDLCLASAAEQIVRYAPCPVLVVREDEHDCLCSQRKPSRD
jgi:universal stress protein A